MIIVYPGREFIKPLAVLVRINTTETVVQAVKRDGVMRSLRKRTIVVRTILEGKRSEMKKPDTYKLLKGFIVLSIGIILGVSLQQIHHKCPQPSPCPKAEDICAEELEQQQEFYEGVFHVAKDAAERCNNALDENQQYLKSLTEILRRCEEGKDVVDVQPLRTKNLPMR